MRLFYICRVFLISPEMLIILCAVLINYHFAEVIQGYAVSLILNDNLEHYLMLVPIGLAVWIFLEIRNLLQDDNKTINILTGWEDYWTIKAHTLVTIIYAITFSLMSLIPWCSEFSLKSGLGFLLFVTSLIGQLCVALTIYNARIRLKEIIAPIL